MRRPPGVAGQAGGLANAKSVLKIYKAEKPFLSLC
jgi:hypothetical protein